MPNWGPSESEHADLHRPAYDARFWLQQDCKKTYQGKQGTQTHANTRLARNGSTPPQVTHFAARRQLACVHGAPQPTLLLSPSTSAWTRARAYSGSQPCKHQHQHHILVLALNPARSRDIPAVHQPPHHHIRPTHTAARIGALPPRTAPLRPSPCLPPWPSLF